MSILYYFLRLTRYFFLHFANSGVKSLEMLKMVFSHSSTRRNYTNYTNLKDVSGSLYINGLRMIRINI